jgi:hypothetical protein
VLLVILELHPQALGGNILRGILVEQRRSAETQGRQLRNARIHHGVCDIFGMQLRLNPVLEARFFDLLDLAGAGAESEAVEGVQDGFVFVQLADRELAGKVRGASVLFISAGRRR